MSGFRHLRVLLPSMSTVHGWVDFDVVACNAAVAAGVAIWLRQHLPHAVLRSEPDPAPSGHAQRPHLLHCRMCIPGRSTAHTREALEAALAAMPWAHDASRVGVAFGDATAAALAA